MAAAGLAQELLGRQAEAGAALREATDEDSEPELGSDLGRGPASPSSALALHGMAGMSLRDADLAGFASWGRRAIEVAGAAGGFKVRGSSRRRGGRSREGFGEGASHAGAGGR